jgi:CubicO group peptidase (beta-lactamase class C family)
MSYRAAIVTVSLLIGASCADELPQPAAPTIAPAAPPPEPPTRVAAAVAPPQHFTVDTPAKTTSGGTFTAPAEWTIRFDGGQRLLDGPEADLHLALIDVKAPSSDAAVAAAWPSLAPDFKRPLKIAQDRPARHGWEEQRRYVYETSPNERIVVAANTFRKGDGWTVLLLQANEAAYERRASQIRLVADSLRPPGYTRESFAGKTAHALDSGRIQAIKDLVEHGRDEAGIPGVAVSLFTTDAVLFEGGFGVREMGKPALIDADTLFIVASNTKGMSTLLLAKLIDEGKFTWDTPVTKIYPAFKLGDADTTSKVLMKHLVCACTGLPRQDYEWLFEFKNATPKTELDLLGTMQPTTRFGEVFQYSNVLASAAGFIGGAVLFPKRELGAAYDEAMRTRVFEPLGMKETTFDFGRALAGDHASPHSEDIDGKTVVAAMDINRAIVPLRPAGGAWSSVRDMRRYVQMELAKGKLPGGKPYISEQALLARRSPQVSEGADETYGMGLSVNTEYGVPFVHHGGSMIGYRSDIFWLPEQGIGGVILTNSDSGGLLLRPVLRRTLELLFDGEPEAVEDVASAAKQRKERIAKERERLVVPPDPVVTVKLAKRYTNPALGDLAVRSEGNRTIFDIGEWKSAVATRKNDDGTVSIVTIDPGVDGFEFVVTDKDGAKQLVLRDRQHEYAFVEKR